MTLKDSADKFPKPQPISENLRGTGREGGGTRRLENSKHGIALQNYKD